MVDKHLRWQAKGFAKEKANINPNFPVPHPLRGSHHGTTVTKKAYPYTSGTIQRKKLPIRMNQNNLD